MRHYIDHSFTFQDDAEDWSTSHENREKMILFTKVDFLF